MEPVFRTGINNIKDTTAFEATMLPDLEKEQLCIDLIGEFGSSVVSKTSKGELIHSCPIPNAGHKNGDKNASASLNFKKLTFNCFGCGSSGGLLWYMAVCRGEDVEGVREWLGKTAGVGGHVMDLHKFLELIDAMTAPAAGPPPIPKYSARVLDPWDFVHPYMTEVRGCRDETLDEFRVGWAQEYPMGRDEEPQQRIIIPQFWRGDLVGWQARALRKGDKPKYKNTPEFPRDRTLYGEHGHDTAVVVESPLSTLRHRHHVPEVLGTFGAEVTDVQIRLLHRYRRVILWMDNDPAGWKATRSVADRLQRHTEVFVVPSEYDADMADIDDHTVEQLIDAAIPSAIWTQPESLIPWKKD